MSFGEFVFSVGFIQKTTKENLVIKGNNRISPRNQSGKTLEHSRRQTTEAWAKWPRKWAGQLAMGPFTLHFQKVPPLPPRIASMMFLKSV
jgi:hypothetical protein